MNRTESAIKILDAQGAYCGQCSREPSDSLDACRDCAAVLETYAHALEAAGLLAPDKQVIRTLEELEALDPISWLMKISPDFSDPVVMIQEDWVHDFGVDVQGIFPLVVIATGGQVRAAREAMEEEHD